MSRILIVAAHPDDDILGCGATIAKHSEKGDDISILILGKGIASRYEKNDSKKVYSEQQVLYSEAKKAACIVGATDLKILDFPDNSFDTVSFLDIIKEVESFIKEFQPEIVYTHHASDLNIDHQLTFRAVLTATRPTQNFVLKNCIPLKFHLQLNGPLVNYQLLFRQIILLILILLWK